MGATEGLEEELARPWAFAAALAARAWACLSLFSAEGFPLFFPERLEGCQSPEEKARSYSCPVSRSSHVSLWEVRGNCDPESVVAAASGASTECWLFFWPSGLVLGLGPLELTSCLMALGGLLTFQLLGYHVNINYGPKFLY